MVQGSTAADTLHSLHSLFCGCKFIKTSFSFSLLKNNSQIFKEKDFNIFYHLREIGNSFYLNNVNMNGDRIIFPNLRIIHGKYIFLVDDYKVAILVKEVNASELILPRLTEISRGGVDIHRKSWQLTNLRRVLWNDIVDQTQFVVWTMNHQHEMQSSKISHLSLIDIKKIRFD